MKLVSIVEKIKDYYIRICIVILLMISFFMFISSLALEDVTWTIPWWLALIYGWSGLVASFKLGNFWYKDN